MIRSGGKLELAAPIYTADLCSQLIYCTDRPPPPTWYNGVPAPILRYIYFHFLPPPLGTMVLP